MTLKKALIALSLCVPMVCGAQVMEKYQGIWLSGMSPGGRYLVGGTTGLTIYDRQDQGCYNYGSTYSVGLGNAVSDNGIVVAASSNFMVPCYWKDGDWNPLPHAMGQNVTFAMANGITPDGSRIVGSVDCRAVTKKAWPMVSPVIWILDEESGEYVFHSLPEPEKDITGCTPQQVSATYISDDGKTVLGQVTDYRGFLDYQIIYREGDDGTWSYETSGNELLTKPDCVWPPYPGKPVKPQTVDYLTDDEILAYNAANKAYLDSLEIVDLTGKKPRMPWPEDFINDLKDEYDAAMAAFNKASETYLTDLYAFFDAYAENTTANRFEFNGARLSANGKYYVCNYSYPDPENPGGNSEPDRFTSPIRYEVGSKDAGRVTMNKDMGVFSVGNDGSMTVATPKNSDTVYSRESYIIDPEGGSTKFDAWIAEHYPAVRQWIEENMTYEIKEGGPDDGTHVYYGTVKFNADATRLLSYFIEPGTNTYVSYFVDLNAESGIVENEAAKGMGAVFNRASGLLEIYGDPQRIDVYDMSGRHVYGTDNPACTLPLGQLVGSGVYAVRLTNEQRTTAVKVLVL